MPAAGHNTASTNASSTPASAPSTASIQQPRFRASSSGSTLNPNAGGFQPGALSSLGEVEHEVLITPMVSSFSPSVSGQQSNASANAGNFSSSTAANPYQQYQHQQQPSASSANSAVGAGNFSNVFGSPLQTPQHQVGAGHNYSSTNPQEWQNFHNVFNAGIGNASTAAHAPGSGSGGAQPGYNNDTSPIGGNSVNEMAAALQQQQNAAAMMAAMQGMNLGGAVGGAGDFGNNAALAAAAALGMNNNPLNVQAQLAMLQSIQQQQMGYPNTQQQALALQQQQVQLQALLATQAQAAQLMAAQQQPGGTGSPAGMPSRFAQSGSQPDLAALAGMTAGNPFMAEQIALQAQYETLRQQQQDLLQRFSEMQFQAATLAQAQAQAQAVQGITSPLSQSISLAGATGSPAASTQSNMNGPSTPARGSASTATAPASASAATGPHRRGASIATANSGPMGQFGSMGQFALPASGATAASTLPKGHGRRHSVNVKTGATSGPTGTASNGISAFSFPTGANNPTQSGVNSFQAQIDSLNSGMGLGTTREVDESEPMPNAAQRALGHGRRESRGSIGSLAGWGSSE